MLHIVFVTNHIGEACSVGELDKDFVLYALADGKDDLINDSGGLNAIDEVFEYRSTPDPVQRLRIEAARRRTTSQRRTRRFPRACGSSVLSVMGVFTITEVFSTRPTR